MFPALHKKFLIITPSLASAFPEATTSTVLTTTAAPSAATSESTSLALPVSLQALIPECAQSCVETILFNEWPLGCSSSGDLECLCSRYSTTGLTLAEAAYACAVTSCPSSTPDLASTYSICLGQDGAVVATHSTLTFTAHITSTAADPTASAAASSTSISSSSTRTNTTSTRNSSTASSSRTSSRTTLDSSTTSASSSSSFPSTSSSSTSSTSSAPSTTSSQSSASSSATAAAAASSSNDGKGLSTAQIVGISVASVSAVVLAVGVLFLMACLRKRDRKKQDEVSEKQARNVFGLTPPSHDNVMSPTALEQFPSPPRNRKDPRNGAGVGTAMTIPQVRIDAASPPRQRAPTPLENIGLAITEDSPIASPASFSSNRTVSQLLPDKPEPVLPRQPDPVPKSPVPTSAPFIAKKKKPSQRDSSMSQGTVFEEDTAVRKSMYPVKATPVPPRKQQPPAAPPIRPYRPPPSFAQEYTESPQNTRQPSLSLMIPPQGRQYPRQPTPSPPPIPSPLRVGRPPNVAKPPIPLYHHQPGAGVYPPAPVPVPVPADPHSSSGSSGSGTTKFTGTNSTASSSYIPAYYTSPPTSIMQTPPESYGGHGTSAAFSNNGNSNNLNGVSGTSGRTEPQQQHQQHQIQSSRSPQRQAQTKTPPYATATAQNRLPPQSQPQSQPHSQQSQPTTVFAQPAWGAATSGQQRPLAQQQQQGSQANPHPPAALRQQYPHPAVPVPTANGQPAFAPPHHHRQHPGTALAQAPAGPRAPNGPPTGAQGGQYKPYSVPTAYTRPPLPPQPQSPPRRPPRGGGGGNARGQQADAKHPRRPPRPQPQRSTSSASVTSFESASPDDPSPPEDEDTAAKQLVPPESSSSSPAPAVVVHPSSHSRHPHARLSPRVESAGSEQDAAAAAAADRSPISDIRYPKVPRASNQAVPRSTPTPSPRSKQQHAQGSPSAAATGSPGAGGLLARRRGEGSGLLIDSGSGRNTPTPGNGGRQQQQQQQLNGRSPRTPEDRIIGGPAPQGGEREGGYGDGDGVKDEARKSSAALPPQEQQPRRRWRDGDGNADADADADADDASSVQTPTAWVPRLTPTRRGDDMYLAVAYASQEGIS